MRHRLSRSTIKGQGRTGVCNGFLIDGGDLLERWQGEVLLLTATFCLPSLVDLEISFPAIPGYKSEAVELLWQSGKDLLYVNESYDPFIAIVRVKKLPSRATTIPLTNLDREWIDWPILELSNKKLKVKDTSTVKKPPLVVGIGGHLGTNLGLFVSKAFGRIDINQTTARIFYTDASANGSAGAPIFDINSATVIGVELSSSPGIAADGNASDELTFVGAVPISHVRFVVRKQLGTNR